MFRASAAERLRHSHLRNHLGSPTQIAWLMSLVTLALTSGCKAPAPAMPAMSSDEMAGGQATAFLRCYERDGAECRQAGPRRAWVGLGLLASIRDDVPTSIVEGFDERVDELGNEVALRRGLLRELQDQEHWVRQASCQLKKVHPMSAAVVRLTSDAEDRLVGLGLGENQRAGTIAQVSDEAVRAFKEARLAEFGCAAGRSLFLVMTQGDTGAFSTIAVLTEKPAWFEKPPKPTGTRERLQINIPGENLIDPWLPMFEEQI